ncbi:hypothetical protein ACFRNJ_12510 [Streptomyces sp. NPDC056721]|jgi:hypothetical protein|uniref:hypothetical protein n=1 Tax=Streptomyces sp. NPDC056721 TaxID=3345923 RepID=UPI0036BAB0EA
MSVSEVVYEPELHAVVFDKTRGHLAKVMEIQGDRCAMRRTTGGLEWWTPKIDLRAATTAELLSPGVAAANARSRGEL